MAANAWKRRGKTKRWRMELKRGIKAVKADPNAVIHITEFGVVIMAPELYETRYLIDQVIVALITE